MDVRRWIPCSILISLFLISSLGVGAQEQLWVGPNVNMVSGTTFPDGDPFLQRQNEPSAGVSTRNPLHILAGANDYRAVDIPGLPDGKETGDSWLGVFESFDGGSRWRSYLMPGYPQDNSDLGMASPLKGYDAGADPVVRAGTDGLFYYAGIVFLRENLAESAIFVARFEDLNNDERGDPIAYIDTQIVATGSGDLFVDKPWMAVDKPRGGALCGNVYVAWAEIDSSGANPTSNIMFSRSADCGATWSSGISLSEAGTLPQGATIAVAPTSGEVYVAWRQHTTLSLTPSDCFYGGGVWKNSPEMWPVDFITMGGVPYTKQQAIDILQTPTQGDATRILAYQLIPAKLNFEVNNVSAEIQAVIDAGDQWLIDVGGLGSKPSGAQKDEGLAIKDELESFNENDGLDGLLGPGVCGTTVTTPSDAIVVAKSIDYGVSFGLPETVSMVDPFDQGTTEYSFRSNSYPTMAVDENGLVYVAWTTRGLATGTADPSADTGDARIVVAVSDDVTLWPAPQPIDRPEVPGHQIKPSLTITGGKLLLTYYDFRKDVSGIFDRFIADWPSAVPTPRHTVDVRAAVAQPGPAPLFTDYTSVLDPVPSTQASRYAHFIGGEGLSDAESVQLTYNAPALPMFKGGTVPFFSDYLDIAPSPPFVPDGFGGWDYNIDPSATSVAHVVWTDDRDVVGPPDGDWTSYVPPAHANSGGASIFDPNQSVPVCDPQTADVDRTRMRNQNIYTARLSEGLYVAVPGNSRPLGTVPDSNTGELLQRAFVVFVQNATEVERSFELSIMGQPTQGEASFHQFELEETTNVTIEAYSSASRTVFVKSGVESHPLPSVEIDVTETNYPGSSPLHSTVLINPDPYNPPPAEASLADGEIYNPSIWNPSIWNPSIWNPSIWNPSIWNPSIWNPSIWNPSIWNPSIWNPSLVNPSIWNPSIWNPSIWNPSIWNPSIWNPAISNPSIWNPSIWNPSIWNTSISEVTDVTWMVRNDGNATSAYSFNLLADNLPSDHAFQLMVYRVYTTPVADGCELTEEGQQETLVNILDPDFSAPDLLDPNTMDPDVPTFFLGPGEEVFITLRVHDPDQTDDIDFYPEEVQVAVVAQGVETEVVLDGGDQPPYAIPDISVPISSPMDNGRMQHTTTPLPDGTILIVGGYNENGTLDTAEIYDPVSRTFTPVPDLLNSRRAYHTATPLNDGTVLIVGGSSSAPGAEIYDPVTTTFTQTIGEVQVFRGGHQATLLHDGRVLITGGNAGVTPVNSVEVYDPTTGTFSLVGSMSSARWEHSATLLSTGEVLVAGGFDGATSVNTAELFDPTLDTFSDVPGTMTDARRFHSATLLPDGTVLLAGGLFDSSLVANGSADVYNRATNSLTPTGALIRARASQSATLLADGKVLLTGGQNMIDGSLSLSSHIELYDWSTGSFIEKGHMTMARSEHQAVRMPDGKVLITGGATYGAPITTGTDIAELYVPAVPAAINFTGDLADTRTHHTATLLKEGTVLIAGGTRQDLQGRASAEVFDPILEEYSPVSDMLTQRTSHTATRLLNGRVLIAGGSTTHDWSTGIAAAEIYDPSLGTFSVTGSLNAARSAHRATLLTDGRVLITGGRDPSTGDSLDSAEIYDPVSGGFTLATGPMVAQRLMHTATRLTDGRVLVVGGIVTSAGPTVYLDSAEIFDPATESFTPTGSMNVSRTHHTAVRLTDGRVLVTGGSDDLTGSAHGTAEVYDPATGSFSYTNGPLNLARFNHQSTRLPDGVVLITGGLTDGLISISSVERFDPVTGTFEATDAMNRWRSRHTATALETGQVLLTAGWEVAGSEIDLNVPGFSAEVYNPPPIDEDLVQRNALIALYNATNGDGWTNNTNWLNATGTDFNEPGTECSWWGVTCDVGGTRVLEITLDSNNLVGWIPPEIEDFIDLEILFLRINRLAGVIPPELGSLRSIRRLDLAANRLSGRIPSAIGSLTGLQILELQNNQLSGEIPTALGNLGYLTHLYVQGNQLSGEIPSELGNLASLNYARLEENQLTGEIPPAFAGLSNLRSLYLSDNQLTGPIPPDIGGSQLRHVRFQNNQLSGEIPSQIGNLTGMEFLHLNDNQLEGSIPSTIGSLSKLQKLTLQRNNLSGSIPTEIGNLKQLWEFLAYSNRLSEGLPPEIGGLASIRILSLAGNYLSGRIPTELGNLVTVERLFLQGNAFVGPIPDSLLNLQSVSPRQLDIRRNGLYSTNPTLTVHLNSIQDGADWESTQTVAPSDFSVDSTTDTSATLSWTAIPFTDGVGGYEVFYSTVPGDPSPDLYGRTADKTVETMVINGLDPETEYYFVVRTVTEAGTGNKNTVTSEPSTEASTSTGIPMIPPEQRAALIALYNSTGGPGWTDNSGWLGAPGTECTWFGVTCGSPTVTRLDLPSNNLAGTLPSELGDFPDLQRIHLSGNQLSGTIPSALGDLSNLRTLQLHDNLLSGAIPSELGNLANLEYLQLGTNDLTGSIPAQIWDLVNLIELKLAVNQLTGNIPPEVANLTNLVALNLHYNQLTGGIPTEIGALSNLQQLYLAGNQLIGEIPSELGSLGELRTLELRLNQLTGQIPAELGNLSNLTGLYLLYNQLTGPIPPELGNLAELITLSIGDNDLSGSIPPEIWNLTNLREIHLNHGQLSGSLPPEVGNLTNLEDIRIISNQFSGPIPAEFSTLPNLRELHLGRNQFTGGIPTEFGNIPNLEVLRVHVNNLTGGIPASLGNLANLRLLDLYRNNLTGPIPAELGNLTSLERLWIWGNGFSSLMPIELANLTGIGADGIDFRWNALLSPSPVLTAFLDARQVDGDWQSTQTLAPENFTAGSPTGDSITLSWIPVAYTADPGYYEVYIATTPGGPFSTFGQTADKSATSMLVDGLSPTTTYYFHLQTITNPHVWNDYPIFSNTTGQISATTGSLLLPAAQRAALIALYNSTGGGSWTNNTNWLAAPGTECTWYGVTCGSPTVVKIELTSNNLVGTIPTEIGNLVDLEDLNLADNQLSGVIPAEIGNLDNLRYLRLRLNQLSGSIPVELEDLSSIVWLDLSGNPLTGTIPPELANLDSLQSLFLDDNQLTGTIPPEIGNLTNLRTLHLGQNQLSGNIPPELGNLLNLEILYLDQNQLAGSIPPELGALTNVEWLSLRANQLTGPIPPELGGLTSVTNLYLGTNQLSGSIPIELQNLGNLEALFLYDNKLTGPIPPELANITTLQRLTLSTNQLSGSIPSVVGSLANLQYLNLSENQLTGAIPPELGTLNALEHLYLFANQLSGSIPMQLGNLSILQNLQIDGNQLTGSIPPQLGNLSNLLWLYLGDNQLTGSIPVELANLSNLQRLGLNSNQLTGSIPPELGSLLALDHLYLQDNQLSGTIPWQIGDLDALSHMELEGNQLEGPIPTSLGDLVELDADDGLDIRWNALFSNDPGLTTFLNSKQVGASWENTQTVRPTNLIVVSPTDNTLTLSWTPIEYTADTGGYDVYYSTASWGSFALYGRTADKTAASMVVEGLDPSDRYYFFIKTVTDPHPFNQNSVTSNRQTPTVSGITSVMPLVITTIQLPYGLVDVAYSQTLSATGGQGTRVWELAPTSPPLPPGMDLHSAGALIGTPSAAGSFPIHVQVTDDSQTTQKELVVTVNHPNLIFNLQPTSATSGNDIGPVSLTLTDGLGGGIPFATITIDLETTPCASASFTDLGPLTSLEITTGVGGTVGINLPVHGGGWGFTLIASVGPTINTTSSPFDIEGFCATGSMGVARNDHSSTLLPSGGVLVAGGSNTFGGTLASAEIFDPITGSFSPVPDMVVARRGHAAEILPDQTVLLVGFDGAGSAVGEIFDEPLATFSPTVGVSNNSDVPSTATVLPNGNVLVIGSYEIFNPATSAFGLSGGAPTIQRTHAHASTLLLDGRVLITGGYLSDVADKRIPEIYDPATDTFSSSSAYLSAERMYHTSTLLPDGTVLIAGGTEGPGSLDSAEIYDPSTDAVVPTGSLNSPRLSHAATLMTNGKVLITGGHDANTGTTLSSAEIFDPSTGSFSYTGSMDTPRFSAGATRLQNDAVLVSGGSDVQSAEVFWPIGDEMMWTRQFGSIHVDFAADVSAGPLGVYVGGSVSGPLPGQTSVGAVDGYLRKYDPAGTELWTRQFGSTENDQVWAVSIHVSGVYVTGHTLGVFPGQSSAGGSDAFVRKYDHAGAELWTRQFGTSDTEMPFGVAVDASGVYLVGDTSGAFPGQPLAGPPDAFVRKYDHSGTELWTRQFGNTAYERGRAIAVDSSGVYIAGHVGGALPGQVFEGGAWDAFIRKYDSDGNEIWTRQFGTSEDDLIGSISVDDSGLYVAGHTVGTLAGQTSSGGPDGFVRRYDSAGSEIWTRQFGTSNTDQAFAVSVRSSGIYVSGGTQGAFPGQISSGGEDVFVRKYGFAGNQVWTHQFGGTADVEVKAVSVDASGLYVCGLSNGTLPGQISEGGTDSFLVKLVQ